MTVMDAEGLGALRRKVRGRELTSLDETAYRIIEDLLETAIVYNTRRQTADHAIRLAMSYIEAGHGEVAHTTLRAYVMLTGDPPADAIRDADDPPQTEPPRPEPLRVRGRRLHRR